MPLRVIARQGVLQPALHLPRQSGIVLQTLPQLGHQGAVSQQGAEGGFLLQGRQRPRRVHVPLGRPAGEPVVEGSQAGLPAFRETHERPECRVRAHALRLQVRLGRPQERRDQRLTQRLPFPLVGVAHVQSALDPRSEGPADLPEFRYVRPAPEVHDRWRPADLLPQAPVGFPVRLLPGRGGQFPPDLEQQLFRPVLQDDRAVPRRSERQRRARQARAEEPLRFAAEGLQWHQGVAVVSHEIQHGQHFGLRVRPQSPAQLLQEQARGLRGPQEQQGIDCRKVDALVEHVRDEQPLQIVARVGERVVETQPLGGWRAPGDGRRREATVGQGARHVLGVAHARTEPDGGAAVAVVPFLQRVAQDQVGAGLEHQRVFQRRRIELSVPPGNRSVIHGIGDPEVMEGNQPAPVDGFREPHLVRHVVVADPQHVVSVGAFRRGGQTQQEAVGQAAENLRVGGGRSVMEFVDDHLIVRPGEQVGSTQQALDRREHDVGVARPLSRHEQASREARMHAFVGRACLLQDLLAVSQEQHGEPPRLAPPLAGHLGRVESRQERLPESCRRDHGRSGDALAAQPGQRLKRFALRRIRPRCGCPGGGRWRRREQRRAERLLIGEEGRVGHGHDVRSVPQLGEQRLAFVHDLGVVVPGVPFDGREQPVFREVGRSDPATASEGRLAEHVVLGVKSLRTRLHPHLRPGQACQYPDRGWLRDVQVGRHDHLQPSPPRGERLQVLQEQTQAAEAEERYGNVDFFRSTQRLTQHVPHVGCRRCVEGVAGRHRRRTHRPPV